MSYDLSDIRRIVDEQTPPPNPEDYRAGTIARGLATAVAFKEPFYVTAAERDALRVLKGDPEWRLLTFGNPDPGVALNSVSVIVDPDRTIEQRNWRPIT